MQPVALPVLQLAAVAAWTPLVRLRLLAAMAWPQALLYLAAGAGLPPLAQSDARLAGLVQIPLVIAHFILAGGLVAAWCRLLLTGVRTRGLALLADRDGRPLRAAAIIVASEGVIMVTGVAGVAAAVAVTGVGLDDRLAAALAGLIAAALAAAAIFLFARLAVMLPLVATGASRWGWESWRLTRGQVLRLAAALALMLGMIGAPLLALAGLISAAAEAMGSTSRMAPLPAAAVSALLVPYVIAACSSLAAGILRRLR